MKNSKFLLALIIITLMSCSQAKNTMSPNKEAISTIQVIFDDYVKHQESTDSKGNKELMTKSLKSIEKVTNPNEFELLINVWMYYDPTDYMDQPLLYTILENNKPQSVEAVKLRIINKKEWESETSAPYSELKDLLQQLTTE
jgi:hypothetical protein